jgi:heme/copper-type cytochrome/quinol oxidase subunit 2
MLSAMEYPHWLMVAGVVLVVLGFIGFAFRQNRNAEPDEDNMKQATPSESIQAALEEELKAKAK